MTYYDIMFEAINERYENGEITFEQANELNQIAFNRYTTETSKETKEKRDNEYYGTNKEDLAERSIKRKIRAKDKPETVPEKKSIEKINDRITKFNSKSNRTNSGLTVKFPVYNA